PALIGIVGIGRETHRKAAHKAHVWGLYVAAEHRRAGVGGALMRAALHYAAALPGVSHVHLTVAHSATSAIHLYGRFGFVVLGTEPEAMRVAGAWVAEHQMGLKLER